MHGSNEELRATVATLLDRAHIRDVLMQHCRGIDRCDAQSVASLYHPDASIWFGDHHFSGATAGADMVAWKQQTTDVTSHGLSNYRIEVNGARAAAESYCLVMEWMGQEGVQRLLYGALRFVDRLENRGDGWKIAHRQVAVDASGFIPFQGFPPIPSRPQPSRDRTDPSYAAFASLAAESANPGGTASASQNLLDKALIHDTLMLYCRGVDRYDADIVSSVFHADARADYPGHKFDGLNIGASLTDLMRRTMYVTSHGLTTVNIEVAGNLAVSEAYGYSMDLHLVNGEQRLMFSATRYIDRFEKRDGSWKISDRVVLSDGTGYIPYEQLPNPGFGATDRSDSSYAVLAGIEAPEPDQSVQARDANGEPSAADIRWLADREAITDVFMQYCRGVDRRDAQLLGDAYHPDAHDDHSPMIFTGETVGQGIVDWISRVFSMTSHATTTRNIRIHGDRAAAEAFVATTHLQSSASGPRLLLALARYVDQLEKRAGRWKLLDRKVICDAVGYIPFEQVPSGQTLVPAGEDPACAAT